MITTHVAQEKNTTMRKNTTTFAMGENLADFAASSLTGSPAQRW
jgi:hypothetical protein